MCQTSPSALNSVGAELELHMWTKNFFGWDNLILFSCFLVSNVE